MKKLFDIHDYISDEEDDFDDEFFDHDGRVSKSGLYDAGGHPVSERFADLGDYLHDQERDIEHSQDE